MAYRPCDMLDKFIDDETAAFKRQFDKLESALEIVEKEIQPFFKAVKKFADTGVVDFDGLRIAREDLNFELDQENAGTKKNRTRNKMATLTENTNENIEVIEIKKEKISEISEPTSTQMSVSSTTGLEICKENIKGEKEDMPAPTWIPPKKKPERSSSRNTRTKGKNAAEAIKVRDSDVIVQSSVITTINLTDTDDSDNEKAQKEESDARRTKTVTRKQVTDSGVETDSESKRGTRSKARNRIVSAVENEEVPETRSTRTKTLRKGKKAVDESVKSEAEESQPETRSTRTKTIRKEKGNTQKLNEEDTDGKKAESESEGENQPETRSTRTKTIRKEKGNTQEPNNPVNHDNNKEIADVGKKAEEDSEQSAAKESEHETRSTRTKTIRKEKGNTQEPNNPLNHDNNKENADVVGKRAEEESEQSAPKESEPETRSTRTKTIKKEKRNTQEQSDIKQPNFNGNKENTDHETTRSTRTKTRKHMDKNIPETVKESDASGEASETKPKRARNSSDEDITENKDRKKSKSNSPGSDNKANTTSQTVYEDALSMPEAPNEKMDATFVTAKSGNPGGTALLNATVTLKPMTSSVANSTVVVEHSKYKIFDKKSNNDIFTEDESTEEVKTPPKKAPVKKATKEVFSPYEKTTLKKKVEAFEKLQNGCEIPVRITTDSKSGRGTPSIQEKAKVFTPSGLKFLPASCSTTKISRLISSQQLSSSSNSSMVLGSKSAQKDPRERQKRVLEKEQALKKKEAMLQAQAEAKRKLNEEKQLKALQQRKVLEAEKKKQLEVQKQREVEREEQSQKLKQELERKRLAQKKKLQENQANHQPSVEQTNSRPIYMTTEPPQLPTDDCYDSDDPSYKKISPPRWCVAEKSKIMQLTMLTAGEKIKNTLFCRHAQTPDLQEIFETIDPKKLKRTSSMYWRKPPRYTMMPDLNETKFSDDEEMYESD